MLRRGPHTPQFNWGARHAFSGVALSRFRKLKHFAVRAADEVNVVGCVHSDRLELKTDDLSRDRANRVCFQHARRKA